MRKLLSLLLLTMLTVVHALTVSAKDVTFTFSSDDGLTELGITKTSGSNVTYLNGISIVKDGVTITTADGSSSSQKALINHAQTTYSLKYYAGGGSISFAVKGSITGITFNEKQTATPNTDGFTDEGNKTWTGSASSVTFTATAASSIKTVTVTYTPAPELYIVGQANGKDWSATDVVEMDYDSDNSQFTKDVWFGGSLNDNDGNGYFDLFYFSPVKGAWTGEGGIDENNIKGVVDNSGERCWIAGGGSYGLSHSGIVGDLRAAPGVYTLVVNNEKTNLRVTQVTPEVSFSVPQGEVATGTVIDITSNLTEIGGAATGAVVEYSLDGGATYITGNQFTLSDYGMNVTLLARATLGDHITATATANYTTAEPTKRHFHRITSNTELQASIQAGKAFLLVTGDGTKAMGKERDGYASRPAVGIDVTSTHCTTITSASNIAPILIEPATSATYRIKDETTGKYLAFNSGQSPYVSSTSDAAEAQAMNIAITAGAKPQLTFSKTFSETSVQYFLRNNGDYFGFYDENIAPEIYVEVDAVIEPYEVVYEIANKEADLTPGARYLFVAKGSSGKNAYSKAAGSVISNYIDAADVTLDNNDTRLTLDANSAAVPYTLKKSESDKWYFESPEGWKLTVSGSSDNNKLSCTSTSAGSAVAITFNGNNATVDFDNGAENATYGYLQFNYNNGSPRFSNYSKRGMAAIMLFKEYSVPTSIEPVTFSYGSTPETLTTTDPLTIFDEETAIYLASTTTGATINYTIERSDSPLAADATPTELGGTPLTYDAATGVVVNTNGYYRLKAQASRDGVASDVSAVEFRYHVEKSNRWERVTGADQLQQDNEYIVIYEADRAVMGAQNGVYRSFIDGNTNDNVDINADAHYAIINEGSGASILTLRNAGTQDFTDEDGNTATVNAYRFKDGDSYLYFDLESGIAKLQLTSNGNGNESRWTIDFLNRRDTRNAVVRPVPHQARSIRVWKHAGQERFNCYSDTTNGIGYIQLYTRAGAVPAPVFSPAEGSYSTADASIEGGINLSCALVGDVTIYYKVNDATEWTAGTTVPRSLLVEGENVIRAYATEANTKDKQGNLIESNVATAYYFLYDPYESVDGDFERVTAANPLVAGNELVLVYEGATNSDSKVMSSDLRHADDAATVHLYQGIAHAPESGILTLGSPETVNVTTTAVDDEGNESEQTISVTAYTLTDRASGQTLVYTGSGNQFALRSGTVEGNIDKFAISLLDDGSAQIMSVASPAMVARFNTRSAGLFGMYAGTQKAVYLYQRLALAAPAISPLSGTDDSAITVTVTAADATDYVSYRTSADSGTTWSDWSAPVLSTATVTFNTHGNYRIEARTVRTSGNAASAATSTYYSAVAAGGTYVIASTTGLRWERVTSLDELNTGIDASTPFIIVYEDTQSGTNHQIMGAQDAGNYRRYADMTGVTVDLAGHYALVPEAAGAASFTIARGDNVTVEELDDDGNATTLSLPGYLLNFADGYLAYNQTTSGSAVNHLLTTGSDEFLWTIDFLNRRNLRNAIVRPSNFLATGLRSLNRYDRFNSYADNTNGAGYIQLYKLATAVPAPVFSPVEGVYSNDANDIAGGVTLSVPGYESSDKVKIYYTTDGSKPTASSTLYSGPIALDGDTETTIRAFATIDDVFVEGSTTELVKSNEASAIYFLYEDHEWQEGDFTRATSDADLVAGRDVIVVYEDGKNAMGGQKSAGTSLRYTGTAKVYAVNGYASVPETGDATTQTAIFTLGTVTDGDATHYTLLDKQTGKYLGYDYSGAATRSSFNILDNADTSAAWFDITIDGDETTITSVANQAFTLRVSGNGYGMYKDTQTSQQPVKVYYRDVQTQQADVFELVTDLSQLVAGKRYIIVNTTDDGTGKAMSTEQKSSNRGQVDVTIASRFITVDKYVAPAEGGTVTHVPAQLLLEGESGAWAFNAFNGPQGAQGYLYPTKGQNYLKTRADDAFTYAISLYEGAAVITATLSGGNGTTETRTLRHNSGSSLFSFYTQGQNPVYLYVETVRRLVPNPVITPASGSYESEVEVSIAPGNNSPEGTTIYYTTDGTDPSQASTPYNQSFSLSADATVRAIAIDSDGNESSIVTATYVITQPAVIDPTDFKRVTTIGNINGLYEYIVVYEDGDNTNAMSQTGDEATSKFRRGIKPGDENSGLTINTASGLAHVDDASKVSVIQLRLNHDDKTYSLYEKNSGKYVNWTKDNTIELKETNTDAGSRFNITVDENYNTKIVPSSDSNGSRQLQYNCNSGTSGTRYAFYGGTQKSVKLYYRSVPVMLADLLRYGDYTKHDDNRFAHYTIGEDLTVMEIRNDVSEDDNPDICQGIMFVRSSADIGAPYYSTPGENQSFVEIKGTDGVFASSLQDYRQVTWAALSKLAGVADGETKPDVFASYRPGDVLKAGTVTGYSIDGDDVSILIDDYPEIKPGETGDTQLNVYCPANFLMSNLNWNNVAGANQYFFVTPKPFEVAWLTWAVYDQIEIEEDGKVGMADVLCMPEKTQTQGTDRIIYHNDLDIQGVVFVVMQPGFCTGQYRDADGNIHDIDKTTSVSDVFVKGDSYQMKVIIMSEDDDEDSSAPVARRLKSIGAKTDGFDPETARYAVIPVEITPTSVVTAIEKVGDNIGGKTVKAVRVYNVAGIELREAQSGVNIIVTEFTDGTVKTTKVVR